MTLSESLPRWPYSSQPLTLCIFDLTKYFVSRKNKQSSPSSEGNDNIFSQVILLDHEEMPQMICHLGKLLDSTSFFYKIGLFP